jgi:hypothetical protein
MKKVSITLSVLLSIFIATVGFFYIRFINLDTYKWDTGRDIISYGNKQYESEPGGAPLNLKLGKQIGKIEGEPSFRIWAIKSENIEDRIALTGFMFPTIIYQKATNEKIEVTINSEINKYSPLMSSTPGMPLVADFTPRAKEVDIKYHWITEQGTLLNWERDTGKINMLGKDIKGNEQRIYWSVDPNEEIIISPFRIYLKIENNDTSKIIYETSIEIEQGKDGFFSIRK